MGDHVRIASIRRFFEDNTIPFREFALTHERHPVNILREIRRLGGLKQCACKFLGNRAYPLLREINWSVEIRQWEEEIDRSANRVSRDARAVDVFHAELVQSALVCRRVKELTKRPYVYDMHGLLSEE